MTNAVLSLTDWYSTGSYFVVQNIIDSIATTIYAISAAVIVFFLSHQLNESKRFWPFLMSITLSHHLVESLVYFSIFLISDYQLSMMLSFAMTLTGCIFSGFPIRLHDIPKVFEYYSHLTPMKFVLNSQIVSIYGLERCPPNQTSKTLLEYHLNDDHLIDRYNSYALIQLMAYRVMAFIVLLSLKNTKLYSLIVNYLKTKFLIQKSDNFEMKPLVARHQQKEYYDNPIDIDFNGDDIEMKPIERRHRRKRYYDNPLEIDFKDETQDSDSSDYYSVHENDAKLYEDIDSNNLLSIAWIDMTLKIEKTFYSKEKFILRGIKGLAQFGTLTALMGPSGAGKTSLLRCLNGKYRDLMTKESKIYLSNCKKIRTCFIAQDQREHILRGLTVRQALLYASKLKNTKGFVDHELNIRKLMEELAITDVKGRAVDKCSFGQQKRVVMAMELTPKVKPNLICVDEPTSGVDSYSALLVCFEINFIFNFLINYFTNR